MRRSLSNRTLLISLVLLMALLLAACNGAAEEAPTVAPTEAPSETDTPEPEMEAVTPAVTVEDQELTDGAVTVASVTAAEPGWMVIHADDNGAPGQVIGQAAVETGENTDVVVEIDQAAATETLYAMLHVDAGTQGEYEFPGDDAPVSVDGSVVVQPFTVTGMDMTEAVTPAVAVEDQELADGTVTIASVTAAEPSWMVIHADDNGGPGQVIGQAAVATGENTDVVVEIDQASATETLYAMLHVDAGTQGEYEFPGDDAPVSVNGSVVVQPFTVTGMDMEADETMEEDTDEEEMSEEEMEQAGEQAVTIANFAFSPNELTVPVGTTVVWTHQDNVGHTVTAGSPSTPNPDLFDSGSLSSGDTFSFTFDEAGSFDYYCTIHPSMTGTITVEG